MKKIFLSLSVLIIIFCINARSAKAAGASLYISPYGGTFFVGDTFNISVFVNTEENIINAVEVNLKFDSDLIQVTSPTAGLSFISIWADQPSYSNKDEPVLLSTL